MKKLAIFLITFCSFIFIGNSNVKAVSDAPVSPTYMNYFTPAFKSYVNNNHSSYLQKYYDLYLANKDNYPYYMIIYDGSFRLLVMDKIPNYYLYYYTATDGTPRQMFYNPYDESANFKYRDITNGNTLSDEKVMIWNTFYSTLSYPSLIVFDSNYPIQYIPGYNTCYGCGGRKGIDLRIDDLYYTYGDIIPTYSEYNPTIKNMYYQPLSIDFTSKNNTTIINDVEKVTSVDLTIDYGFIDNDKYIYMYMFEDENFWNTYYFTNSSSITLNIDKNRHVIARILDKETYEPIDTKTFSVVNIDYDLDINFSSEKLKDDYGNVYQTNLTISYDSLNRDLFDYEYRTDYFILEGNEFWAKLDDDKSSIMIQNRDNINIFARIIDKSTGNVLKSATYKIVQNIDKPKISFKSFNNLKYLGGATATENAKTIVESVDLTIDYGLMDNETYGYMWKYYDENVWHTEYLLKNSIDINITKNTTIIAQVINKNDNSIVTNATYTITTINNEFSDDSIDGIFDYITDNNNTNSTFSIFSSIWESFKNNNKIYTYLMLVISTSIIILVLKSMGK